MSAHEEVYTYAQQHLIGVKKSGDDNIMASCPFHAAGRVERSPSFTLSLSKGLYFCFSCGEKGNFKTLLRAFGASWAEIEQYKYLLDELGQSVEKVTNVFKPRDIVFDTSPLPNSLLGLFDYCPLDLVDKGFSEETLQYFDVGFNDKNYQITFPLYDLRGNLVGVSGRRNEPNARPRYKVYDWEYEQWGLPKHRTNKSSVLWNAHRIISSVYFSTRADLIVVEGFKAAMWLHQHGYKNVVALLGRYLSEEQQWILEWLGARVYLLLDNNVAGISGTAAIATRLAKTMTVHICQYGDLEVEQPDELTEEQLNNTVSSAPEYHTWVLQQRRALK